MSLEFCPRAGVYTWADAVIKAHPHHNVIIFSHYILDSGGSISGSNAGYGDDAQTMYNSIIRDNTNVKFTFSGHVGTDAYAFLLVAQPVIKRIIYSTAGTTITATPRVYAHLTFRLALLTRRSLIKNKHMALRCNS